MSREGSRLGEVVWALPLRKMAAGEHKHFQTGHLLQWQPRRLIGSGRIRSRRPSPILPQGCGARGEGGWAGDGGFVPPPPPPLPPPASKPGQGGLVVATPGSSPHPQLPGMEHRGGGLREQERAGQEREGKAAPAAAAVAAERKVEAATADAAGPGDQRSPKEVAVAPPEPETDWDFIDIDMETVSVHALPTGLIACNVPLGVFFADGPCRILVQNINSLPIL